MSKTMICPKCHEEIDIDQAIQHRLEEQAKDFEQQKKEWEKEAKEQGEKQIKELMEKLEKANKSAEELAEKARREAKEAARKEAEELEKSMREQFRRERDEEEKKAKERLKEEQAKLIREAEEAAKESMKAERESWERRIKEREAEEEKLRRERLEKEEELEKLKRQNRDALEEKDRELRKAREEAADEAVQRARKQSEEERSQLEHKYELRIADMERKLQDTIKASEDAVKKANQGSMERQGEVFEDYIKEQLQREAPLDEVTDVKKGETGADLILSVKNERMAPCGEILIEIKRTKAFNNNWIGKLKGDMLDRGAKLGIIISEAMPGEVRRFDIIDGVYVCSPDVAMPLIKTLRLSLIEVNTIALTQTGKEDKIERLYDFMTSRAFSEPFGAVIRTYEGLRSQLDKEKRAIQKSWKYRESALSDVFDSMNSIYGQIKYIAGENIDVKELADDDYDEFEELDSPESDSTQAKLPGNGPSENGKPEEQDKEELF